MPTTTLADILGRFLARDHSSANRIAKRSGVPKQTISNWLEGRIQKPHQWQPLLKVAAALHLTAPEVHDLLVAAGHLPLAQLRAKASRAADYALFDPWPPSVQPVRSTAPFQAYADLANFVGRTREIAAIKQLLQQGRHVAVCSVQGMGGVGKTALVAHLAYELRAHFVDGVLWAQVDAADPLTTLAMFARALGEDVSQIRDLENRSAFVRGLLGQKRVLVILDNATTSAQVRSLLPPTNGTSAALITTRQDLAVTDTLQRFMLKPFDPALGESLALLVSFLGATFVRRQHQILSEVVELLGHLPLAVSIAAARIRQAPDKLADLLAEMRLGQQRLGTLVREDVSVRLSFDVSYQRLPEALQRCFVCLALFAGDDFAVEAVAFVTQSSAAETAQHLAQLCAFSLLQESHLDRYRLHPLLRDYAGEHLAAQSELQRAVLSRMIEYFVQFIEQHTHDHAALDVELSNLFAAQEAALQQQKLELLVRAANGLALFLETRGLYEVAERQLQRARQAAEAIRDYDSLATTLLYWGMMPMRRGDYAQAEALFAEGLQIAQWAENPVLIAYLERYLATVYFSTGEYHRAILHNERSYEIALTTADERLLADSTVMLGTIYGQIGAKAHADRLIHEGLALARKSHHKRVMLIALFNLGNGAKQRGDWAQAEVYWYEGLEIARETHHRERISGLLGNLGGLLSLRGNYQSAEAYLQEGLALARELGHRWLIVSNLHEWGYAQLRQQKVTEAQATFTEALGLAQTMNTRHLIGDALYGLAQIALAMGDQAAAHSLGQESLTIFEEIQYHKATVVRAWLAELNLPAVVSVDRSAG